MFFNRRITRLFVWTTMFLSLAAAGHTVSAQSGGKALYDQIKAFQLTGGKADVSNLVLKRDRVVMTFNGTFYFTAPVERKVTGAVFLGKGTAQAEVPPNAFEKANIRRLLKTDNFKADFTSAVMRFTDDTFDIAGKTAEIGAAPAQAQKLGLEADVRTLEETGANLAARTALSLLNAEKRGFFHATFDGGSPDRFSYLFDPQCRIPTANFGINAGEKGLIYAYQSSIKSTEVWTAFYSEEDYAKNIVAYSDIDDLVDTAHYDMEVDLRTPKSKIGLRTRVAMQAQFGGVRAIPFTIGESLGEADNQRLKKQMRLKAVRLGTTLIDAVQEGWEGGLTVFLPNAVAAKEMFELELEFEGDFLRQSEFVQDCSYPRSNTSWYPRHGYLDRATFDLKFTHPKKLKVATVGMRESEIPSPEDKDVVVTKYKMTQPVAFVTFALGPWQRHADTVKWDSGEKPIPLEFNSVPGSHLAIKEDFILAELNNSVRYFHALFGAYPYETYSATFHPYGFGQGFPSMLMIPPTDHANKYTYSFIAHETAHQWWGNIIAWRSYRDQWLSEGFAEYSGALYTAIRENPKASRSLIDRMRDSLKEPPGTMTGIGSGKLNDVGPIILGHRLNTTKTFGAYQTLIYNKGALALRMMHFLFTDPSTGNGDPFFAMMKDFVEKHRNNSASTDDFRLVANAHFVKTAIARKYQLTDLNWFFRQWVYETDIPSYQLEYTVNPNPDGSAMINGNVIQENVDQNFFMALPLVIKFGGNNHATGTVSAYGPKTPFQIKLPIKPTKIELDPHRWVLSTKTETK